MDVEPGGGAGLNADLDLAHARLERGRAARDATDAHVAIGAAGVDVGVRVVDGDAAVGRVHPQVTVGLADPAVAVGVLDHRIAVDLAQPYPAGPGAHLGRARHPVRHDGAGGGARLERARLLQLDVAGRELKPALAETAGAAERRDRGVAVHLRAGRQADRHVDRPGLAEQAEAALPGRLDEEPAGRVLDPGLLGGSHVGLVGFVARANLHGRVVAVARGDAYVTDDQLDHGRDRLGGVEGGHDGSSWRGVSVGFHRWRTRVTGRGAGSHG